jgi:hypothetical protein
MERDIRHRGGDQGLGRNPTVVDGPRFGSGASGGPFLHFSTTTPPGIPPGYRQSREVEKWRIFRKSIYRGTPLPYGMPPMEKVLKIPSISPLSPLSAWFWAFSVEKVEKRT